MMEPQPGEWKKAAAEIKQVLVDKGVLPTEAAPLPVKKKEVVEKKEDIPVVERDEPIWPVELSEWKEAMAKMKVPQKKEEEITPERKEEIRRWAKEAVERWWKSRPTTRAEKKEKEDAPAAKVKPAGRQKRLGQTKLIDDLLRAGKTEAEITEAVKTQIPSYPVDRIPKMIKLRQYHIKAEKVG